jgi:thiol-disulfide isomerase/thioredoxin
LPSTKRCNPRTWNWFDRRNSGATFLVYQSQRSFAHEKQTAFRAFDILAGLATVVLFVAADGFLHVAADFREAVVVLALLSLAAGLLRGSGQPANAWLKGLLVASCGSLALLGLGWDSIQPAFAIILLLVANLFTVCGVRARQLWSKQSTARGGVILLSPLALLVIFALTTIPAVATRVATRRITGPSPAFSLTASDGGEIDSAGLRGNVVVLDLWATWCPACRRELPELDRLYRRYQGNSRLRFWAVDVLTNGETSQKAREFLRQAGYALPVAFGSQKLRDDLGGDGLPLLIILDKSGRIRLVHDGYDRSEPLQRELSKEIETLLHEA